MLPTAQVGRTVIRVEVLARLSIPAGPVPDTGSLRGDMRAMLQSAFDWLTDPGIRAVLPDLIAEPRTRRSGGATRHPAAPDLVPHRTEPGVRPGANWPPTTQTWCWTCSSHQSSGVSPTPGRSTTRTSTDSPS